MAEHILELITERDENNLSSALKTLGISSRSFRKYYFSGRLKVNGKEVRHRAKVEKGSRLTFVLEEEETPPYQKTEAAPVLYEDEWILAVEKPAKLLTHESKAFDGITFRDQVATTFAKRQIKGPVRFINRLDMDSSGILLVAKHDLAQGYYQKQLEKGQLLREYIAIAKGHLEEALTVNVPIGRDPEVGIKRKAGDEQNGLPAKTKFWPMYCKGEYSIVKARIITGRTHQIRVHLGTLGMSLVGDGLYGDPSPYIDRQALHSFRTRGKTPEGKVLDIVSPLPKDMNRLLETIF